MWFKIEFISYFFFLKKFILHDWWTGLCHLSKDKKSVNCFWCMMFVVLGAGVVSIAQCNKKGKKFFFFLMYIILASNIQSYIKICNKLDPIFYNHKGAIDQMIPKNPIRAQNLFINSHNYSH